MVTMSLLIHINIITKTRRRYDMIKNTIKKLIEHSIYTTFKLLSKLPNKNLIYFESFHGKQYSDNPKALYEYLTEHSDAQLIWGVKKGYEHIFQQYNVPYVTKFQ